MFTDVYDKSNAAGIVGGEQSRISTLDICVYIAVIILTQSWFPLTVYWTLFNKLTVLWSDSCWRLKKEYRLYKWFISSFFYTMAKCYHGLLLGADNPANNDPTVAWDCWLTVITFQTSVLKVSSHHRWKRSTFIYFLCLRISAYELTSWTLRLILTLMMCEFALCRQSRLRRRSLYTEGRWSIEIGTYKG